MINIKVKRSQDCSIEGFVITGHAGYASEGEDIVCAAVSSISYTLVGALTNLVGDCEYEEKHGYMMVYRSDKLEKSKEATTQTILESMYIGYKQIENSYGEFVNVAEDFED